MTEPRTEREPDVHSLHPELTLAGLVALLPSWVRPDPDREDWVEVLRERLPPALRAKLLIPLVRAGSLELNGRAVLPRADWAWLAEWFLFQARAVLERRDALLQAEADSPLDELAWSSHVEDWQAMDLGVVRPYLAGWIVGPRPGEADAFGPKQLLALGPGEAWARLLQGWVSLGRRDEMATAAEPRHAFPPRPLDRSETDARLADARRQIERQVADLVPPSGDQPSSKVVVGPLDGLQRPARGGEDGDGTRRESPAGAGLDGTGWALTTAERLVVQVYRIFGHEMPFWLLRRNSWLGQERPIDLLANEAHHERLAGHLRALEAGVYL